MCQRESKPIGEKKLLKSHQHDRSFAPTGLCRGVIAELPVFRQGLMNLNSRFVFMPFVPSYAPDLPGGEEMPRLRPVGGCSWN